MNAAHSHVEKLLAAFHEKMPPQPTAQQIETLVADALHDLPPEQRAAPFTEAVTLYELEARDRLTIFLHEFKGNGWKQ